MDDRRSTHGRITRFRSIIVVVTGKRTSGNSFLNVKNAIVNVTASLLRLNERLNERLKKGM
eukprot:scaffold153924_cov35-Attheya_sp.AAC.1